MTPAQLLVAGLDALRGWRLRGTRLGCLCMAAWLLACTGTQPLAKSDPTKDALGLPVIPEPPTDAEIAAADIGPQPSLEEIKRTVRIVLQRELKDYESARIEFVEPTFKAILIEHNQDPSGYESRVIRSYYRDELYAPAHIAWTKLVYVNAKNSYGGYSGYKTWAFHWVDGAFVFHDPPLD